jgi:hypothetical protein
MNWLNLIVIIYFPWSIGLYLISCAIILLSMFFILKINIKICFVNIFHFLFTLLNIKIFIRLLVFLLQLLVESFECIDFIESLWDLIKIIINYCQLVLIFFIYLFILIELLIYVWQLLFKVLLFIIGLDSKRFRIFAKFNFVNFVEYFFIHLLYLFIL